MNLNDILADGIRFYNKMQTHFISMSAEEIKQSIEVMQNNIREMQAISYKLAKISNVATNALKLRNSRVTQLIQCYPTDYTVESVIYDKQEKLPVEKGVYIPMKIVNDVADIPTSSLYYVRNIKQYAVNINGINVVGDLCNVSNTVDKSVKCHIVDCNVVDCRYYHTPEQCKLANTPLETRNLPIGSWVHNSKKGRHCGSRSTLHKDLHELTNTSYTWELDNREAQLIHDILIYQILKEKNMLSKYNKTIVL